MAEYLTPGVFIEDSPNPPVIESVSASTGGFIGVAGRGPMNTPVFITSWNAYINTFAVGLDSPFMANSDLAYSVYGFFQNGGKRCYVMRVADASATKASTTVDETAVPLFFAKDEGSWANGIKIIVAANEDDDTKYDVGIFKTSTSEEPLEIFTKLSGVAGDADYIGYVIDSQSQYVNFNPNAAMAVSADDLTLTLSGGTDGLTGIIDSTYTNQLPKFDQIDDVNLLCIPGQTSTVVNQALMNYCEKRADVFAILDAPQASTSTSVVALRKTMSCKNAALYFPWIKVSDPLSKTGKLRACPTCGHVMGVYARTIAERGVWKAPAGTEAIIRGAVEVVTTLTNGDTDILNPAGVVSIIPKTNYGIVIWGARSLHPDSSMKYISDILLDINIKKSVYNGTQPFVFEPNDSKTWTRVKTTIEAYLDNLWRDGALFGEKAKEAYFVKCDEDLNPANVRDAGKLICEIGYASKKPAEFVIFRFSHQVASN